VVRLSRSSDVKGLEAWAAKNEVSRSDVMAQLAGQFMAASLAVWLT
jgi:hypothetical protein